MENVSYTRLLDTPFFLIPDFDCRIKNKFNVKIANTLNNLYEEKFNHKPPPTLTLQEVMLLWSLNDWKKSGAFGKETERYLLETLERLFQTFPKFRDHEWVYSLRSYRDSHTLASSYSVESVKNQFTKLKKLTAHLSKVHAINTRITTNGDLQFYCGNRKKGHTI